MLSQRGKIVAIADCKIVTFGNELAHYGLQYPIIVNRNRRIVYKVSYAALPVLPCLFKVGKTLTVPHASVNA